MMSRRGQKMEFIVVTNLVSKNLTLVFISIDFRAFFFNPIGVPRKWKLKNSRSSLGEAATLRAALLKYLG